MSADAIQLPSPLHYDALVAKYKENPPLPRDWSFCSHVLDEWARDRRNLKALHWVSHNFRKQRIVTYAELAATSHRTAIALRGLGIRRGDKVLVQLPRVLEWWDVILGLMRLGAIPIPGTTQLVAKDLKFRTETSKARAFVGDHDACSRFVKVAKDVNVDTIIQVRVDGDQGLLPEATSFQDIVSKVAPGDRISDVKLTPDDIVIIYFTSGTTGNPKQVLLTGDYLRGHIISGYWYRLAPGKLFSNAADLGWAKAAYSTFGAFNLGATLFIQPPNPGTYDPMQLVKALHKFPITTVCCPPTIYRALVSETATKAMYAQPPKALEHCVSAGEPLNPSVIDQWRKTTGITICDGWGQTETVIMVGNFEGVAVRPGSMGRVAPAFEVSIIGPRGEELGDDEEGELACRVDRGAGSRWIFKGYIKNGSIDKRQKTFDGKTWYCTGDRGRRDKDGYFWFVGRDDDVITSSGYRIGPFEVESALKAHPAVLESAVVASPDLQRGEIVKAFVILSDEFKSKNLDTSGQQALVRDLQAFVRENTAPYKYPRAIEFVETLPKTVSGKIRRVELRNAEYSQKADIVKQLKSKL